MGLNFWFALLGIDVETRNQNDDVKKTLPTLDVSGLSALNVETGLGM